MDTPNWEKRYHPLRDEWVVYAAHRNNRPWSFDLADAPPPAPKYDPGCYLCPGNRRNTGAVNPTYKDVFVFDNDFPVVAMSAPDIPLEASDSHDGLYRREKAAGIARVICYAPEHNRHLGDLEPRRLYKVFDTWKQETITLAQHDAVRHILIFENRGEAVGVSNPHPHCQIYAVDFVFNLIERELRAARGHRARTGRNLFADVIAAEQKDAVRIVAENDHAVAFIPFFARYAYEILIFPKKKHATLRTMTRRELHALADVYQEVVRRYDRLYDQPFPYVMTIHQAPVDGKRYNDYHLYCHFQPPLRQPGLAKFLAGPEIGGGNFMADTMPELKAKEL